MSESISDYWSGALRRLQAEVDGLSKVVKHSGEMGRENELALSRVLASLIPKRFGTGSGLLIDSHDQQSAQVDVVVFEHTMEATLFAQTTQLLFPIETVYSTIEVKTTLREDDLNQLKDVGDKFSKLKSERRHKDATKQPLRALFAYKAWVNAPTLAWHIEQIDEKYRPDIIYVVDQGLVGGWSDILSPVQSNVRKYEWFTTPCLDTDGNVVEPGKSGHQLVNGVPYRVLRLGVKESVVVDPARGLLLFLEALLRTLHQKTGQDASILSLYLNEKLRFRRLVEPKTPNQK